uniref:Putative spa3c5a7grp2 orysj glycine-rich cell wall structural protein 2 n=1 Tax=Rhipicephalus microplus TaxID=6941 RepID=A0A6G5A696_RHIMP
MKTFAAAVCALLVCSVYADKDEKVEARGGLLGAGLGGYGAGVGGPGLVGAGLSPVCLGSGYGGGFQSGYGNAAGAHQAGFQGGAGGYNQGSGAFAGGASNRNVNAYNDNKGYSHSSGFSSSDSKSFGSGHKQGSSGFQGGAAGHQGGFGQQSFGHQGNGTPENGINDGHLKLFMKNRDIIQALVAPKDTLSQFAVKGCHTMYLTCCQAFHC